MNIDNAREIQGIAQTIVNEAVYIQVSVDRVIADPAQGMDSAILGCVQSMEAMLKEIRKMIRNG